MSKYRLMTPGPTQVPERALLRWHGRSVIIVPRSFVPFFEKVLDGLKYTFQTANDVLVLTSSGTGAMEAAVVDVVPQGGKAIVLESGKFSQPWRLLCETFGIEVVRHEVPWGEAFSSDAAAKLLEEHPALTFGRSNTHCLPACRPIRCGPDWRRQQQGKFRHAGKQWHTSSAPTTRRAGAPARVAGTSENRGGERGNDLGGVE